MFRVFRGLNCFLLPRVPRSISRRLPVLIFCVVLFGAAPLRLQAQAIQPPVTVPAESAIASDAANLSLKKDLDQRHQSLQQRFEKWNAQAAAFNTKYGGRDFDDGSAQAAAGLAEQARLSKSLKSYQRDAALFKADTARLRLKTAEPIPAPSVPAAVTGAVGADHPAPEDQPALTDMAEVIDAMDALAARLGWSPEKQAHLDQELKKLGYERHTSDQVRQTWKDILDRGPDSVFAHEASSGGGPGFAGAGKQTAYSDCAVFAMANAAGLPYGLVGARAADLVRQGEWRSGTDRRDPGKAIEQKGLNGGEVVMLAEAFGQAEVVPDNDFAKTLKEGRPVLVNVVPSGGAGAHEVVLTKTFQHAGATWYEMMESYHGPQRRLYLSAVELTAMQKENAVAFRPEAHRTPQLLR